MTIKELKTEIVKEFRASLDKKSKFIDGDVCSFKERIKNEKDKERLNAQLGNLRCLNGKSKSFNKKIIQFTEELDKGGMFEVGKMKPENGLD